MNRRRVALWAGIAIIGAACLIAVGFSVAPQIASREDAAVEWALRLPKERERARLAGFTGTKRVASKVDPRTDAGADWVRLDAQMRANAPDGKLPDYNAVSNYINPLNRRQVKRATVMAMLRQFEPFLADADRAGRKPRCTFAFRVGESRRDGENTPICLAMLHLAAATKYRGEGKNREAMRHVLSALRIARQSQTQGTWRGIGTGLWGEQSVLLFVRDGLTDLDAGKRKRWAQTIAPHAAILLHGGSGEVTADEQMRLILREDFLLLQEMVANSRIKKRKKPKMISPIRCRLFWRC
ncbi:MAG: hypothetical protein H7Y38_01880 [Armatimonadetes bacterium]|nr:hypothetical protein [Armatimonadota bacterium]